MMSHFLFLGDLTDIGNDVYVGPGTDLVSPGLMILSMPVAIAVASRVNVTSGCRTVDVLADSGVDNIGLKKTN